MKKRLVIPALLLSAAALSACSSGAMEDFTPPASAPAQTIDADGIQSVLRDLPIVASEANPKTDNNIDAQQVRDIQDISGHVFDFAAKHFDGTGRRFLDGFPEYAKQQRYAVTEGNHVSLSYSRKGALVDHCLVRVWNPESPAHSDPASSYAFDIYATGGRFEILIEPYATPKDLDVTVDLTDIMTQRDFTDVMVKK